MKANRPRTQSNSQRSGTAFNPQHGSLVKITGEEIFLENRLSDFLKALLDQANNVVSKEELMAATWKDIVVTEESVTKAASDLRKFLIAHNIDDYHLETISKRGYMLRVIESSEDRVKKRNPARLTLKILGYFAAAAVLYVLIIRAINY